MDLEHSPNNTMAMLPKQLIVELRDLPGVPRITYQDLNDIDEAFGRGPAEGKKAREAKLSIDHDLFDKERYLELMAQLMEVARQRLTSHQIAKYMLEVTGNAQLLEKSNPEVRKAALFLPQPHPS
jgi:hypothetical protein